MGLTRILAELEPVQVDHYRVGDCFGEESQLHFETKLELQHWLQCAMDAAPDTAGLFVEWLYPWNRCKRGKKFSWYSEDRLFGDEEWMDVNWLYVPTPEAAIHHKYLPRFVFDLVCESDAGLLAVFEVISGNPAEPEKRAFCRRMGVPLYEIDAERFAPQFAARDKYTYTDRKYAGPVRYDAPLVGGGKLNFAALFRELFPR